jgi:hypothetical protein
MFDPVTFIAVVCAVVSLACMVLFGIVDFKQWRGISTIQRKVEAFESIDPGESFGDWLLAPATLENGEPNPEGTTNLALCCRVAGHEIAGSFKMGIAGIASGESRIIKSVQNKVVAAVQTPETKALMQFCEQAGIPEEYATVAYGVLDKMGLLPKILKNNGQGSGGQGSWGPSSET